MQSQFSPQTIKAFLFCMLTCISTSLYAAELRIKYDFQPKAQAQYATAVIYAPQKAQRKSSIDYLIVDQNIDNVRLPLSNVQVVAAVNNPKKQPPKATLSYSYTDRDAPKELPPVVVAVGDRSRQYQITHSSASQDTVYAYVVGLNRADQGFSQLGKTTIDGVARKIEANRLTGCAEINFNCSRTATDSRDAGIDGANSAVEGAKKRQVLTP